MTTETTARITGYDYGVRPDPQNETLFAERVARFNARTGPRVGDFAIFPDGHEERFSHDWQELGLQTSRGGSWYLAIDGFVSFSGGLNPTIPLARIEPADERRAGAFWFFDRAWARAHSAVYVSVECRVYRIIRIAAL